MSDSMTVTGVVESKRKDGKGIKVNGEWYSVFNASSLRGVEWKDTVTFNYIMKGTYRNIQGPVTKTEEGGSSPAAMPTSKGGGYSNLGVELGHAANLAMEVMIASSPPEVIGTDDFYKKWVAHTDKIYKAMRILREHKEHDRSSAAPVARKPAEVAMPIQEEDNEPF